MTAADRQVCSLHCNKTELVIQSLLSNHRLCTVEFVSLQRTMFLCFSFVIALVIEP